MIATSKEPPISSLVREEHGLRIVRFAARPTATYGMGVPGANVLGASVRYTNSKKTFSIGLNVEGIWYDNKTPAYFKQYDYPVPKAPEKD